MNKKTKAYINIGISILFAAAILISSSIIEDKNNSNTMMYLLIAIWFVPYSYLNMESKKCKIK